MKSLNQEREIHECQESTHQPEGEDMASGETHIQGPIRESKSAESGVKKVWVITGAKSRRDLVGCFTPGLGRGSWDVRRQWGMWSGLCGVFPQLDLPPLNYQHPTQVLGTCQMP